LDTPRHFYLKNFFFLLQIDNLPKDENIVVSRYIDNPLLIDGIHFI